MARRSKRVDPLSASTVFVDRETDLERWRLLDENGRHTWHYLKSDEEVEKWPQTIYDRHLNRSRNAELSSTALPRLQMHLGVPAMGGSARRWKACQLTAHTHSSGEEVG